MYKHRRYVYLRIYILPWSVRQHILVAGLSHASITFYVGRYPPTVQRLGLRHGMDGTTVVIAIAARRDFLLKPYVHEHGEKQLAHQYLSCTSKATVA